MLGPLKFGLQKTSPLTPSASPLAAVKAAVAPAHFALTLTLEGSQVGTFALAGPKGATAYIEWGDGTNTSVTTTGASITTLNNHSCGTTATISGSNLITFIELIQNGNNKIKGITGTYPASLDGLHVGFNFEDPIFTPPNIRGINFLGSSGPSRLDTEFNLVNLYELPPNLEILFTSNSPKLTSLPTLPPRLVDLSTPAGLTVLPTLPGTLTALYTRASTKITSLPTLPPQLTALSTPPGLTILPALPDTLRSLELATSAKITRLPILPPQLSSLITPPGITGLPALPPNLTSLSLYASTNLTRLPTLPPGLNFLKTPPGITGLPALPDNLTGLELGYSSKLTRLPTLPPQLSYLGTPPGITGLPAALPDTLTDLNTYSSTKLTSLSILGNTKLRMVYLSPACKSLDLSGCTGLKDIRADLKSTLTTLDISNCTALTSIPTLPTLTTLRIDGSGLTSLDLTKTSVTTLNIPPSMNSQLRTLKVVGSKLKLSGLLDFSIPQGVNWTLY